MVIDFHTHTFPEAISKRALEKLSGTSHMVYYTEGSEKSLIDSMIKNGVNYSVSLPVMTSASQVESVNSQIISRAADCFEKGIILFGGMHPEYGKDDSYKAELKKLADNGIKGVKLHPAFQAVDINDITYKRIMDYASELGMIILIHSGLDISFLDHNYASIDAILDVVDSVHPEKFVLAHMGGWQDWDNVKKYLAGADVYLDTAFSIGPIEPRTGDEDIISFKSNMAPEQFYSVAKTHGCDKVLLASDSPWAHQGAYIDYIKNCPFEESEKSDILGKNAEKLLRYEM